MLRTGSMLTLHPSEGRAAVPHGFVKQRQRTQTLTGTVYSPKTDVFTRIRDWRAKCHYSDDDDIAEAAQRREVFRERSVTTQLTRKETRNLDALAKSRGRATGRADTPAHP